MKMVNKCYKKNNNKQANKEKLQKKHVKGAKIFLKKKKKKHASIIGIEIKLGMKKLSI